MVLKPLEFSDCLSDSPWFRQNLREHELVLDEAYKNIKNIETQCRELITCTKKLSLAQKAFAKSLSDFKIETVGAVQTDEERVIANCLKDFARLINQVEDERSKIINEADANYLEPLRRFRTEGIGRTIHEEKRKYEKEATKFNASLEKHLHLSTVKKNDFREADAQLDMQRHNFCKASLQYVAEIQSVQERMKFEFVETLSSFLYSWLSFYHIGYVIHEDFKPSLDNVQVKVQKTKENFKCTQQETEVLKEKMLQTYTRVTGSTPLTSMASICESPIRPVNSSIKQGYVYMQEKGKLPKTIGRDVLKGAWTKYYCVYSKETRIFTMIPDKSDMKGALGQSISFKLKECMRRASDSIDKRFCFDVVGLDRPEVYTLQALSEEDRRQWIDALDGKQPIYSPGAGPSCSTLETQLDEFGFEFVGRCISTIEEKGITEQGLYRNCGVTSKVQKLIQMGLESQKQSGEKMNWDDSEWETKTMSSAVKTYLRNLPEPLMTFDLHSLFINGAKLDDRIERINHIHYYVHKLPDTHKRMLELVIRHLKRVADRCNENLMTVGNLGVCFGPTLLRPKEETMAAIMDIKFCNVVVEVLIGNCTQIFDTPPPSSINLPCPPKPDHSNSNNDTPTVHTPVNNHVQQLAERQPSYGNSPKPAVSTPYRSERVGSPLYDVPNNENLPRGMPAAFDPARSIPTIDGRRYDRDRQGIRDHDFVGESTDSLNSLQTENVQHNTSSMDTPRARVPYYMDSYIPASRCVRTLYACTPDHESELSFDAGQIITNVQESREEGWLVGTLDGKTGLIPSNYVEPLP